jgi:sugar phosphate isomerase/epimerase
MTFRCCGFTDEAGRDLKVQIGVLNEVGWKGMEPRMVGETHVCDLTEGAWQEMWAAMQKAGLAIPSFGGQIANWSRAITADFKLDVDELKRVAPRMRQAGCKVLRIMSYPNAKEPWPVDQWKKEVFRRLRELAKIAEGEGVVLGHENCSGYGALGPQQYLEMAEKVKSPAFKMIFDTGNQPSHGTSQESTWEYYQAVKDQIVHVHVKATKLGKEGKSVTCWPDEDPMQKRVLADLKAYGYKGWVSIEPHLAAIIHEGKKADDPQAARKTWVEYAQRLDRILAGL